MSLGRAAWECNTTSCLFGGLWPTRMLDQYVFAQYSICTWFILEDNSGSLVYTVRLYWNHHLHLNYDHISMICMQGCFFVEFTEPFALQRGHSMAWQDLLRDFIFGEQRFVETSWSLFFTDEHEKSMQLLWPKVWRGCLTKLSMIPYNLCSHLLLSHVFPRIM